jgi:hypothetical protein
MMRRTTTEALGWCGLVAVVGAYAATNLGLLAFGGTAYLLLNLAGAVALLLDTWPDRNWQTIILNVVWAAIALVSLVRIS